MKVLAARGRRFALAPQAATAVEWLRAQALADGDRQGGPVPGGQAARGPGRRRGAPEPRSALGERASAGPVAARDPGDRRRSPPRAPLSRRGREPPPAAARAPGGREVRLRRLRPATRDQPETPCGCPPPLTHPPA